MEHHQANPCSRLGTAAGINPVSPQQQGKKKNPAVSPAGKKSFNLVWKMLLLFLLSNISSRQSPLCSHMETGAGAGDVSSKWHQELPLLRVQLLELLQSILGTGSTAGCQDVPMHHGGTVAAQWEGINPWA